MVVADVEPGLLTCEEVAAITQQSVYTVRRLIRRGELNGYLVGGEYRVNTSELVRWLESKRVVVETR
jgi:excisionase family DNA binding protein